MSFTTGLRFAVGAPCGPGPYCASVMAAAWWRADDLALSNNDPVASWADASGNGFTMAQATSGNRPTFKTSILGSMPVVRFDGSNDRMSSSLVSALTDGYSMVFVGKNNTTVPHSMCGFHNGDGGVNGWGISMLTPARTNGFLHGGVAWISPSSAGASDTSAHILVMKRQSANVKLWKDGGSETASYIASSPATPTTRTAFGSHEYNDSTSWSGDIAEALIFTSPLSVDDINLIGAGLAAKWGTTWTPALP